MNQSQNENCDCRLDRGCCQNDETDVVGLSRRQWIGSAASVGGAAVAGLLTWPRWVIAEPGQPFEHLIPEDKKLSQKWLDGLVTRSEPERFSGWDKQLKYIGMPIGGIGCGQLYLGGDGRLWLWDIFKCNYRREPGHGQRLESMTLCGHYTNPIAFGEEYNRFNGAEVQQGFAIEVQQGDQTMNRTLDHDGFPAVSFRGEYPIGKVTYEDEAFPVKVELHAFSPFIPLNARDSALPATVMSFTVTNTSDRPAEVELAGWLQNATCPYVDDVSLGKRKNRLVLTGERLTLLETVVPADDRQQANRLEQRHGFGSMALSIINAADVEAVQGSANVAGKLEGKNLFSALKRVSSETAQLEPQTQSLDQTLIGALGSSVSLQANESKTIDFAITWYFPDYHEIDTAPGQLSQLNDFKKLRRHYADRFDSADGVADYLTENRERLLNVTRLWNQTWYDSSLPHWLLDRTFISIDCAATHVLHWFDSGRLYGWEGVDCCPGTCTHVWHYAQGLSRIFPELERTFREVTDYGIAFRKDGLIGHRAENHHGEATDGQAGTILRVYREHLMSPDDDFLNRLWPKIKNSIQFLLAKDPDGSGLIKGKQPHTLDAAWYGPMAWISGLYLASLAAGAAMAKRMGDHEFAQQCQKVIEQGKKNIVSELFNGEYFIHQPDPKFPKALRSGNGCHIDQVLGQAWVYQVGLERVIPKQQTTSALNSLWKYNFAPDAGQYAIDHVEIEQTFRWYAMQGESGLLMCTWPQGGAKEAIPGDRLRNAQNPDVWSGAGGYFNECMNGFEYQVAAHMIYEGEPDSELVERGLAVTRAVHERYGADKRNPYNEIECSDHYARSMASYGVFLAVCGFEYDGPQGHIGFAPRITPENFQSAFTAAEGWGVYAQQQTDDQLKCRLELRYGKLNLNRFSVGLDSDKQQVKEVFVNGQPTKNVELVEGKLAITFAQTLKLSADQALTVEVRSPLMLP